MCVKESRTEKLRAAYPRIRVDLEELGLETMGNYISRSINRYYW